MRQFIGIIFVALGGLLLLSMLDIIDFNFGSIIGDWWPIVFVLFGIKHISENKSTPTWGIFLIIVGTFWIGRNLDFIPFSFWELFWPIVLVFVGISILFGNNKNKSERKTLGDSIKINAVFSGSKERLDIDDFKGGEVNAIFGGVEIDISECNIATEAHMEVNAVFGGLKLRIDRDTKLILNGTPIMGGLDNKVRGSQIENPPVLHINYTVIFGGIEITD